MADVAAADAVGERDGDALAAQQRLGGNDDAVAILVGFLAAAVGILPDRYRQLVRHPGIIQNKSLRRRRRRLPFGQIAQPAIFSLRFGAVRTWVAYSVRPVKARAPSRLRS